MKPVLCFVLVFFCIAAVKAMTVKDTGCLQYHRGKFTYVDSTGYLTRIKRKKNYQFEYNMEDNVWINFRIKWISDCEYELYQIGTNSKSERKNNHTVRAIIISKPMGNDGYEYTCGCKATDTPKIKGFTKKVKHF